MSAGSEVIVSKLPHIVAASLVVRAPALAQICLTKQQWWTYEQEDKQKLKEMQIIGFTSH